MFDACGSLTQFLGNQILFVKESKRHALVICSSFKTAAMRNEKITPGIIHIFQIALTLNCNGDFSLDFGKKTLLRE